MQGPGTSYVSEPQIVDVEALSEGLLFLVPWETYIEPIHRLPDYLGAAKTAYRIRQPGVNGYRWWAA